MAGKKKKKAKKSNGAFERIMAGMEDAIAFARGDETRGRVVRHGTPPWPPKPKGDASE